MDNKIIDGMKKESKKPRNAMILCYLFAVLMHLVHYLIDNDKFSDLDILLIFLCFAMQNLKEKNHTFLSVIILCFLLQKFYHHSSLKSEHIFKHNLLQIA